MIQPITPTVWIVDDDEDDQLFISAAFLDVCPPINTLALRGGEELMSRLTVSDMLPRLILLDINMPLKDGFETLKELRCKPDFADLPVVMLTTSSDIEDRQRSLALGANHFLTKPHDYNRLRSLAEELSQQWQLT